MGEILSIHIIRELKNWNVKFVYYNAQNNAWDVHPDIIIE